MDDRLLGDRTAAILCAVKADRIAKVVSRVTKTPCNCNQRKMAINEFHRKMRHNAAARAVAVENKRKS